MRFPFHLFSRPKRKIADSFGRSDCGRIRNNNEDSFALLPDRRLFMVADGMGGHNAGEVASQMAIEQAVSLCNPKNLAAQRGSEAAIQHFFIDVFTRINHTVIEAASRNAEQYGMGATLTVAYLEDATLHCCHVGDSRCYRLRGDDLDQITTDHVVTLTDTENVGRQGLKSNAVTRIIGYPFPEDPECRTIDLQTDDRILLCSDGLWSMLSDEEIRRIMQKAPDAEQGCNRLIDEANGAGGRDNITAVLIFVG